MSAKQNAKKIETAKRIVTKSGFSFTPPEHLRDDWDFVAATGRLASPNLTAQEAMAGYFDVVNMLLSPDDLERLKAHVKKNKGYCSFDAMQAEIKELIFNLKETEGNSSSSPE